MTLDSFWYRQSGSDFLRSCFPQRFSSELDARTPIRFCNLRSQLLMNFPLFRVLAALFILSFAGVARADDFKSVVLVGPSSSKVIQVAGIQYLVIRNFTQDGGSQRGVVTVNTTEGMANVLTAAILDPTNMTPLEPINDVIIAGPAGVTVTCGSDAIDCYISYKKVSQ